MKSTFEADIRNNLSVAYNLTFLLKEKKNLELSLIITSPGTTTKNLFKIESFFLCGNSAQKFSTYFAILGLVLFEGVVLLSLDNHWSVDRL